jgi:LacI family transcriptional regulator
LTGIAAVCYFLSHRVKRFTEEDAMERERQKTAGVTTLQDVARRAGVASSTASYVLNNKPKSFGDATRERVFNAARELGYRPNMAARSLATNRTNIIALWVPDVASAFSARVISEIQRLAWPGGYEVLITEIHIPDAPPANAAAPREAAVASVKLPLWNCDGIIAFLGSACRNVHLDSGQARRAPFVSMGAFPVEGTDFVGVELYAGTQSAVRQLAARGARRIAYVVPAMADFPGDDRREAYLEAVREMRGEPIIVHARSNTRAAARDAVASYLSSSRPFDGVFCYNDDAAIGTYRALRDAGLRIPEDVAIVGCDGIEDVEFLDCPLSTLVLPVEEMCAAAWRFLALRLQEPGTAPQQAIFPGRLEIRRSLESN